jgi:hypothetical protein
MLRIVRCLHRRLTHVGCQPRSTPSKTFVLHLAHTATHKQLGLQGDELWPLLTTESLMPEPNAQGNKEAMGEDAGF